MHHLEALAAAAWIGDGRCTTMAASIWTQCSSAGVQLIWWAAENCSTVTTNSTMQMRWDLKGSRRQRLDLDHLARLIHHVQILNGQ